MVVEGSQMRPAKGEGAPDASGSGRKHHLIREGVAWGMLLIDAIYHQVSRLFPDGKVSEYANSFIVVATMLALVALLQHYIRQFIKELGRTVERDAALMEAKREIHALKERLDQLSSGRDESAKLLLDLSVSGAAYFNEMLAHLGARLPENDQAETTIKRANEQ